MQKEIKVVGNITKVHIKQPFLIADRKRVGYAIITVGYNGMVAKKWKGDAKK